MSQRRMFSPDIVSSEEFLTMPVSSRELYFQLGMNADDDGFVQPGLIMKLTGSTNDDLKVLLAKRFLLSFQSGVVVIKHWLIHNMIRADRYKTTRFQEEKNMLIIKENKAYTEENKLGCQNDNQLAPQVRLGKVRLGKNISVAKATVRNSNESKISSKLVNTLKELSPTGELDGDYKIDNLFPAKIVAKQIIKFTGKDLDLNNPEHHEEIVAQFKGLISKLDDFDRNKATKMSYIKYNFNSLAAKASKK